MKEMLERAVLPDLAARAGRAPGDRQPRAAHLGRERVAAWPSCSTRGSQALDDDRRRHASRSSPAASRASRCASPPRRHARRPPRRCSTPRRPRCGRCSATSCSAARTCPMEAEVGRLLEAQGLTLAVAESLTGGLVGVAGRRTCPGSSEWFKGGVVAYDSRGEVRRARRARGAGRQRGGGQGDGRRRAPAARRRRRPRHHRRGRPRRAGGPARRARCGSAWPSATTSTPSRSACPATATGCASSA